MHTQNAFRPASAVFFGLFTLAVYTAAWGVAARLPTLARPDVLAAALTLDLMVVVPAAFYFLVVRRWKLPAVTLVPVFVLSALAASRLLPAEHQSTLRVFELLAFPAELALLGWIGWRASRAWKTARQGAALDPLARFRNAAFELTRQARAADILGFELAVLYYALAAWRARPDVPAGSSAFAPQPRASHRAILLGFTLVLAVEGAAVHLLLVGWSPVVAWIATLGTLYTMLWLLADYRATVLRPILVDAEGLTVRAGLRGTLRVSRREILELTRKRPALGKECANLTLLGAPNTWIVLTEPRRLEGPYGLGRTVRALGVELEAPDELERVLRS